MTPPEVALSGRAKINPKVDPEFFRPAENPLKAVGSLPDVVVLIIDALRDDRVTEEHMPRLHEFSKRGARYRARLESKAVTDYSSAEILFGRPDVYERVKEPNKAVGIPTFPGYWNRVYHTQAWLGNSMLGFSHVKWMFDDFKDKHFLSVGDKYFYHPDSRVWPVISWLPYHRKNGHEGPYMTWLHCFGVHAPYDTPFKDTEDPIERRVKEYDYTCGEVDEQIAKVLDLAGDDCIVVVTSDHGELLGEHDGLFTHGQTSNYQKPESTIVPRLMVGGSVPVFSMLASTVPASRLMYEIETAVWATLFGDIPLRGDNPETVEASLEALGYV
jgi:membrane-anchored protein YejM (alkaline phosphatase superfamily)